MGDALAVACYERKGFSDEEFARYHPGGRLGRKLQRVEPLMHSGDDLPQVLASAPLREAVEELSRKRLGMVCVIDDDGRLTGVLTDGDLRRRMLEVDAPLSGDADGAMTPDPLTIPPAALAGEALKCMEERKITALPVVDAGGKLLGLIQIHDLWRTELF